MIWLIAALYGFFVLVAATNAWWMPRPGRSGALPATVALIPARNEAANLAVLLPILHRQGWRMAVYDDESTDATAQVAAACGAAVLHPDGPLPTGWTGKNRACHALGQWAESTDAEWFTYLDADVKPLAGFSVGIANLMARASRCGVITGMPHVVPGVGVEPLFMQWVGWLILATNPFGIAWRTRIGHNRFLNGQIQAWRRDVYIETQPHLEVSGQIMEDVMIARYLARRRIPVMTARLSDILEVRMYRHWRETLDGFSKNAFEITNSYAGSIGLAMFLMFLALAWVVWWPLLGLLLLSGAIMARIARAPMWSALFLPAGLLIGAFTILRSVMWRRRGIVTWKGRTYS